MTFKAIFRVRVARPCEGYRSLSNMEQVSTARQNVSQLFSSFPLSSLDLQVDRYVKDVILRCILFLAKS
jgi:hypothetical protein